MRRLMKVVPGTWRVDGWQSRVDHRHTARGGIKSRSRSRSESKSRRRRIPLQGFLAVNPLGPA